MFEISHQDMPKVISVEKAARRAAGCAFP